MGSRLGFRIAHSMIVTIGPGGVGRKTTRRTLQRGYVRLTFRSSRPFILFASIPFASIPFCSPPVPSPTMPKLHCPACGKQYDGRNALMAHLNATEAKGFVCKERDKGSQGTEMVPLLFEARPKPL